MRNFLDKIKDFFSNLWSKTSVVAKAAIGGGVLLFIILLIVLVATSARPDMVPLVRGGLSEEDYRRVTQELDLIGEEYNASSGTRSIYVSSNEKATRLRTEFALDDILQDKDGYEFFDTQSFTTTEFERSVQLQRSIKKSIELHLASIDDIEKAEVEISFPKIDDRAIWITSDISDPLTASVILTPAPGSEIATDNKRIKGIQNLVAKGVDRLEAEDVHVFDHRSNELTAMLSDDDLEYNKLLNMNKFKQKIQGDIKRDLESILVRIFNNDRYTIAVNTAVELESGEKVEHKIEPIQIRADNPETPSDESIVRESVPITEQTQKDTYRGQVFIPEGSPSPDFTIPPGAKQLSDQYNTYTKDTNFTNYEVSTSDSVRSDPAGDVMFINVSIGIDYDWEWERDPETNEIMTDTITRTRSRGYIPVNQEILDKIRNNIEAYINNSTLVNSGKVAVETFLFRATLEKHNVEDEEYFAQKDTERLLMYSAIGLGVVIIFILLFFWIRGIIRERKRRREEELARQRQAMREAAISAAEQEGVILDMSPEDKARLEMQENAIRLARERPEDVAKLLRTWMAEE